MADEDTKGVTSSSGGLTKEERRKRNKKRLLYFIIFVIFQIFVITLFSLTVMKFKNPKFRVLDGAINNLRVGNANSPSFSMILNGEFGVKNTNFGHFKWDESAVVFAYRGIPIAQQFVDNGRARARSTKRIDYQVEINVPSSIELGNDLSSGILPLESYSKLSGKITLMKLLKKKKSAEMACTIFINISLQEIDRIECK